MILLDIGLPTLNGIEAARQIRKFAPESKIIFVSQESSADIVQEALSLGTCGYVVKSQAQSDLLAAVDAVLEGRQFVSGGLTRRNLKSGNTRTTIVPIQLERTPRNLLRTGQPVVDAISAAKGETKQPVVSAVNLGGTLYVSSGIERILEDHRPAGPATQTIKDLRGAIRFTINQLSDAYSNKFCRAFLRHHNGLSKIA